MGQDDAQALAERLLAVDLPQRWAHVQAVAAESWRLCAALDLDASVVVAGAWLHDLGYAPTLHESGFHPLDGARYLARRGWDDAVCGLVAHHTDAATQADRLGLGDQLRAEFRDVAGLERDVLWTADATTGPAGQRMTIADRVAEIVARYGPDDVVTECMVASRTSFEAATARVAARMDGEVTRVGRDETDGGGACWSTARVWAVTSTGSSRVSAWSSAVSRSPAMSASTRTLTVTCSAMP